MEELDSVVASRLLEHVQAIPSLKPYEEEVKKKQEERKRQIQSLTESIAQIPIQQQNLAKQLSKTSNEQVQTILLGQIEELEQERQKLLTLKTERETEQSVSLQSLELELQELEQGWSQYPHPKRQDLLNFLVEKVVITFCPSPWLKLEVHWLHEEWGIEQCYYRRASSSTIKWLSEEDKLIRELYPCEPREKLLQSFPTRTWYAIRHRAVTLHCVREIQEQHSQDWDLCNNVSLGERQFRERMEIQPCQPYQRQLPKWERLCLPK